ncbi:HAMP domain-containing histidine kinase [Spongiibacter sp. KMU-158]|uniref:histidine kinase n=1 Tax=Spongiibacter pelagi TaxID=2760804 RepID=A0A927C1J1_9GAMM|nr:HAMP domain-containing sensor histidine kinase [Spongiibacter pelagi]MBD2858177.1 HAMP domain-containing histidine kinase [Spongiibacter pelagi]
MFLSKIFTSFTFRFLVGYVAWLSVSVFMVLGVIYAFIAYDSFSDVHRSVNQELDELSAAYLSGGVESADTFIREHSGPERLIRFFYFIGDENRQRITGSLEQWPATETYRDGWLGFDLQDALSTIKDPVNTEFIARIKTLPSGEQVLVARHYADILTSTKLVAGALIQSMVVTIILGTLGGAVATALSLRQIERINKTVRHIMSGDFSERIDGKGSRGDLRQLSININQMLDRIEVLMNGVRQVSDNIAHDLRTPLTRLRNRLSELYNETACPDAQGEVAALIEEADGLLGTFSALLRITQVESGNRRSGFADIDLCTLVSDVIELYEPLAQDKDQQLETGMAKVGAFHGDRNLLFQAVANLVDNAIKYTPEGGRVFVGLSVEPAAFKISVADSGVGIPAGDKEKVFQRFFRVESSRGKQPGNGLGLSLVQAVVRLHEGEISLEDNHPGLRVVIRLPRDTTPVV